MFSNIKIATTNFYGVRCCNLLKALRFYGNEDSLNLTLNAGPYTFFFFRADRSFMQNQFFIRCIERKLNPSMI